MPSRSIISIFAIITVLRILEVAPAYGQDDPAGAAQVCQPKRSSLDQFGTCWVARMMSTQQQQVASCYVTNDSVGAFAFCVAGLNLTPTGRKVANCALQPGGNIGTVAVCAGLPVLDPASQRMVACIAANRANYWGAALCAGGHNLNPEQAVIANCASVTGMRSLALAGCVEPRFSVGELQKCVSTNGSPPNCFEDTIVVRVVHDAWEGIARNQTADLGKPMFSAKAAFNAPPQITGGPSSAFHNPSQIWGGTNSVLNNTSRLVTVGAPVGVSAAENSYFINKSLGIHY